MKKWEVKLIDGKSIWCDQLHFQDSGSTPSIICNNIVKFTTKTPVPVRRLFWTNYQEIEERKEIKEEVAIIPFNRVKICLRKERIKHESKDRTNKGH